MLAKIPVLFPVLLIDSNPSMSPIYGHLIRFPVLPTNSFS